jgi:S-(hydroxymethyl)glutathione dehydrogenase/alcohol dehydrogenase
MKALVFHKTKDVRVETVPDPRIENARDVILSVTSSSITGSDLHVYNGRVPHTHPFILGREFMGVVVEVGPRVRGLKKGDRVVVPSIVSCGDCYFCSREMPAQCEKSNPRRYGPDGANDRGGGLFGAGDEYGSYEGGQAQYVRVPYADVGPRKVPPELSDESALFLSDTLPAAWTAVKRCELEGGETVAVFGCGPVGLMAMKCARLQGAARVIAVDTMAYRREAAHRVAGAETLDPAAGYPVEAIRLMTDGRGADACVDAVGMDAEHDFRESVSNVLHLQRGTIRVLRAAIAAVRRGGVVSAAGLYAEPVADFPIDEIFEKALRVRTGQAPIQNCIDEVLGLVAAGRLTAEDLVTHRLSLHEAPDAYRIFNAKLEDCLKIILKPWEAVTSKEESPSVESDELDSEPGGAVAPENMPPTLF